ncbi:MAG: hypothetical protein PHN75_11820, partial [Syntrophales bacterium]|nr:hypothetical protein [Syntrophales bacterium]
EQIERQQKESLVRDGVKVIAVEQDGGSPADVVEGLKFLRSGGLVSMTGDRLWRSGQRSIPVTFLGHEAFLPELPFVMALLSGVPLFAFFAYRTGKQSYHFRTVPLKYPRIKDRRERDRAIRQAAQSYADLLEESARQHPGEWFHFEPFIGKKINTSRI